MYLSLPPHTFHLTLAMTHWTAPTSPLRTVHCTSTLIRAISWLSFQCVNMSSISVDYPDLQPAQGHPTNAHSCALTSLHILKYYCCISQNAMKSCTSPHCGVPPLQVAAPSSFQISHCTKPAMLCSVMFSHCNCSKVQNCALSMFVPLPWQKKSHCYQMIILWCGTIQTLCSCSVAEPAEVLLFNCLWVDLSPFQRTSVLSAASHRSLAAQSPALSSSLTWIVERSRITHSMQVLLAGHWPLRHDSAATLCYQTSQSVGRTTDCECWCTDCQSIFTV